MGEAMRILVTGAGGFIGHHLVKRLVADGHWVRGVDLHYPLFEPTPAQHFLRDDLREPQACVRACRTIDRVYDLAADMGGIGYITTNHAQIARNNSLIRLHMLEAVHQAGHAAHGMGGVARYLYTSSACVYPVGEQQHAAVRGLREEDAWPADPEPGYGLEKLYGEKLCEYYAKDHGLDVRVARLHNVYGPLGTWEGGKEKAPAALCRKVAEGGEVVVWGDGKQTRSFMYVDDCVEGLIRLMASDHQEPVNIGTEELVSVVQLLGHVQYTAGIEHIEWSTDPSKPQGVRGRNSDNAALRRVLGWEPRTSLRDGIAKTYPWIAAQVAARTA